MLYFAILGVYFFITIILHKIFKVTLWNNNKERRAVFVWFILIFLTGSLCDFFATSKEIWVFPGSGILGIRVFYLPIEEFVFFIIIPYFVLVLYKVLNKIFNN